MKKLFAVTCVLLVSAVTATAQSKPKVEAYGGYSVLRLNLPETFQGEDTKLLQSVVGTMLGWNGGVTANITDKFGITGDVSGYYRKLQGDFDGSNIAVSANIHSFLVGPRVSGAGDKARPFAHALFGIGRINGSATMDSDASSFSNTGFAMAFGGGLDVVVSETVAIRPFHFDFFPSRQKNEALGTSSITLKNIRFGTGVVFYLR
jgi:opacity protein-like surface antigen